MVDSFVALGDSFSEGLDDPRPDGSYRGWADRVAERLAAEHPGFAYANLAVRGRLIGPIVAEQVPLAVTMRPALVSLAGGTNDLLRPRFDADLVAAQVRTGATALAESGARVVLFTNGDPTTRFPMGARLLARILRLNEHVRTIAADVDAVLVDFWASRQVWTDARLWSVDRLHLNDEGHRRAAAAVLEALGYDAGFDWRAPLPPAPTPYWAAARAADARWARDHLVPWIGRRLRGTSSGDDVAPKWPTLTPYG